MRRVAITSIGVISSLGFSPDEIISSLKKGKVSFERPVFDRDTVSCPIKNFRVKKFTGRYKNLRYLNRGAQFALAAAVESVEKSGLKHNELAKSGLFVGAGPNLDIDGEFPEIRNGKIKWKNAAALWMLKFLPNTAASAISSLAGIHGENSTVGTACSASTQAIGEAFRKIKEGHLDLAFAGAGDSRISPGGIIAYKKARALYTGDGYPEKEYSPFDENRKGFVIGEGGAFFLLEDPDHARKRGTPILAEVCGFGSSMDGYNMTAPDPDGRWGEAAVRSALREAGLTPDQVDLISAHGTGTPLNDDMEADMIERVYGENSPRIIALKSWTGHLASACGAMELAILLSCMAHDYLPRIRNLRNPCNQKINFVREDKHFSPETAVVENFGFGGQNSVLVIKKMERMTINTGLDGFVMIDKITHIRPESISAVKRFSYSPPHLAIESLAQLGAFHVRHLIALERHAFLLKINHCSTVSEDLLTGKIRLVGRLTGKSEAAYAYHLQAEKDNLILLDGEFLYGTVEYDTSFNQEILQQHYRRVLSCLRNDTKTDF